MSKPMLSHAFEHHVWATLRVIDACVGLTDEQLAMIVPGTYGSILDTMRHTVGADSWYLWVLTGGRVEAMDDEEQAAMDLRGLRSRMEEYGPAWASVLAERADPDQVVVRNRDDGSSTTSPVGLRLAQAIHHGTDHRSQICTALTSLGIEPPEIDLWAFGVDTGIVTETPPTEPAPAAA